MDANGDGEPGRGTRLPAPLRVLFMGSGAIAREPLTSLLRHPRVQTVGLVTQPDRPRGRRLREAPCPLKAFASRAGLPCLAFERIHTAEAVQAVADTRPDLVVVMAYGQYIPDAIRLLPPRGAVNLHPSLLPRYRGAAPIQRAIAAGEVLTGMTLIEVSAAMDAGPVYLQHELPIRPDDNAVTLGERLAVLGAALLIRFITLLEQNPAPSRPQEESAVTLAPKLTKQEGRMDWSQPAYRLHNRVRGFQPWPLCFCECPAGSGKVLRVLRTAVEDAPPAAPGVLLEAGPAGPLVAAGAGALRLLEVQPAGRRPMSGGAFLNGHPLRPGTLFG